ncbi:hypothetical protein [Streptomyces tirandamycinicus]|uniref:Uncharacterized protein n=1 Tax=Streptomyces tirandamycinicus TaxID=2174846 RepID=A0A2S1STN7_9ACTN|nr:hypothetical protein [Streptomyces tirandamycinicus]AWI29769.1 hypothetical protein DDW44_13955 [Streptomyces tirandamycinicus]
MTLHTLGGSSSGSEAGGNGGTDGNGDLFRFRRPSGGLVGGTALGLAVAVHMTGVIPEGLPSYAAGGLVGVSVMGVFLTKCLRPGKAC